MTCTTPTKVPYLTIYSATAAALDVLRDFGTPQRPYRCECGKYHLTSKGLNGRPLAAAQVRQLAYELGVTKGDEK